MKSLTDYTQGEQTALFDETGAFFFFFFQQLQEKAVKGVQYCQLQAGIICPKDKARQLIEGLRNIYQAGIKRDLEENGTEAIIERELYNHECFYTYDLTDVKERLEDYGISAEQIETKFKELAKQQ